MIEIVALSALALFLFPPRFEWEWGKKGSLSVSLTLNPLLADLPSRALQAWRDRKTPEAEGSKDMDVAPTTPANP